MRQNRLPFLGVPLSLWMAFFGAHWTCAQEMYVLGLQSAGQATVIFDHTAFRVYIIDLGKAGDGNMIRMGEKSLQELTEAYGMRELNVVCSHPHADHMGGIKALFETKDFLFVDGDLDRPRFERVTVVEHDVPRSLAAILETVVPKEKAAFVSRRGPAGDAFGPAHGAVQVEAIPYEPSGAPGPHGRSIVSLITLDGRYVILDPDDADSAALRQVAKTLAASNRRIDAFIVPHHGSRYHDIEPLLGLGPKTAIIAANAGNVLHPAPEILQSLMDRLEPRNVLFTGSISNIRLGPEGVVEAVFSAANRESYALFVEPSRRRLARQGKLTEELIAAYDRVRQEMIGGAVHVAEATAVLQERVQRRVGSTGTLHTPAFEAGYGSASGSSLEGIKERRVFQPGVLEGGAALYVQEIPEGSDVRDQYRWTRYAFDRGFVGGDFAEVVVYQESPTGVEDGLEPPERVARTSLDKGSAAATAAVRAGSPPAGGMVWITGDRLVTSATARAFSSGTVDLCGSLICVHDSEGDTFSTRYPLDGLFSEVWERVYERGVDTFYLSINPTRNFLDSGGTEESSIPSDRLVFGFETPGGPYANEVVTAGDIADSDIGRILWEADVAFKSSSLGFDVLAGMRRGRGGVPKGLAAGTVPFSQNDLAVDQKDRWCRLYWSSGVLQLSVDEAQHALGLTGDAVRARAEPMQLVAGELQDYPAGGWCEDAKAVAAELELEANDRGGSDGSVRELAYLAELQTLVRWMREDGMAPSPVLLEGLRRNVGPNGPTVPRWTSGIRSQHEVLVQEERRSGRGRDTVHLVHVSLADAETLEDCVLPAWETQWTDFPAAGYEYDEATGTWEGIGESRFLKRWMERLAKRIVECSSGTLLPANGLLGFDAARDASERTTFGIVPHLQAVHYHGGVFLGEPVTQPFLTAAIEQGVLRDPSGHLLFQQHGENLHFWRGGNAEATEARAAQHVVFRGAQLRDAYAAGGRLRFLVETVPGGIVRRELRARNLEAFPTGLEWADAMQGEDGAPILAHAAWPCLSGANGCLRAVEMPNEDLAQSLEGESYVLEELMVTWLEDSTWVVDLDITSVEGVLDGRWDALVSIDASAALGLAKAYENWGFMTNAAEKAELVMNALEGDGEDALLGGGIFRSVEAEIRRMLFNAGWTLAVADITDQLRSREITPAEALESIDALELLLESLPHSLAAAGWRDLEALVLECARREGLEPALQEVLASARARYESRARRSRALARGVAAMGEMQYKDWLVFGSLRDRERDRRSVELEPEPADSYVVAGWCNHGCRDLDLFVYDSEGRLLGADAAVDAYPSVRVQAGSVQELDVEVLMAECEAEVCQYAFSLRPDEPDQISGALAETLFAGLTESGGMGGGDVISEGQLMHGESTTVALELGRGMPYRIEGRCDWNCTLDLRLLDPAGVHVFASTEPTDFPLLEVTPQQTTTHTLEIGMSECENEPCAYSVELAHAPVLAGDLLQGAVGETVLTLEAGVTYSFSGRCDVDCSELALTISDADDGAFVAASEEGNDFPVVLVEADRTGDYTLRAMMAACDVEPCGYSVGWRIEESPQNAP